MKKSSEAQGAAGTEQAWERQPTEKISRQQPLRHQGSRAPEAERSMKTEQRAKEAEEAGMTLTEYLESINPLNEANKIDVIKDISAESGDKK